MKEETNKIIENLENNIIQKNDNSICSCISLFKEYCRRMALWAQEMSLNTRIAYRYNLAIEFDSKWKLNDDKLYFLLKERGIMIYSPLANDIIINYVHWELYKKENEIIKHNLPNPYEPFILLLKRGGNLHYHNGWFDILGASFSKKFLNEFPSNKPIVELDYEVLDKIDKEYNEKRQELGE